VWFQLKNREGYNKNNDLDLKSEGFRFGSAVMLAILSFSSLSNDDSKTGLYIYQTVFWVDYVQATGKIVKEFHRFIPEFTGYNVTKKTSTCVIQSHRD
jgi:hypothetical protein